MITKAEKSITLIPDNNFPSRRTGIHYVRLLPNVVKRIIEDSLMQKIEIIGKGL